MPKLLSGQYIPPLTTKLITEWWYVIKQELLLKKMEEERRERWLAEPEELIKLQEHRLTHPTRRALKLRKVKNVTPNFYKDR